MLILLVRRQILESPVTFVKTGVRPRPQREPVTRRWVPDVRSASSLNRLLRSHLRQMRERLFERLGIVVLVLELAGEIVGIGLHVEVAVT